MSGKHFTPQPTPEQEKLSDENVGNAGQFNPRLHHNLTIDHWLVNLGGGGGLSDVEKRIFLTNQGRFFTSKIQNRPRDRIWKFFPEQALIFKYYSRTGPFFDYLVSNVKNVRSNPNLLLKNDVCLLAKHTY